MERLVRVNVCRHNESRNQCSLHRSLMEKRLGKCSKRSLILQRKINGWQEDDKAIFLAAALEGRAALVLGNLSDQERRNYQSLVSALTTCFGMTHQSELARAKLKCRSKGKEESMPELAESVETLTRVSNTYD